MLVMADRRNLKVKPVTHEAIKAEQRSEETIDDTLQRVLGIAATPEDIEHGLAAYLPPRQQEQVREHIDLIRSLSEFEERVREGEGLAGGDVMDFVATETGVTVAQVECAADPANYIIRYRGSEGQLNNAIGTAYAGNDYDHEENLDRVEQFVQGAVNRWT